MDGAKSDEGRNIARKGREDVGADSIAQHPNVPRGRLGVLLVNLGTPDAPTPKAVRKYLKEFLSDRRVIEIPPLFWQPILRGIILNTRPKKSAKAYQKVWSDRGSPLAVITQDQAEKLQTMLGNNVRVDWAMRYGNPSIPARMEAMMAAGCERIVIAPLYPQYSAATSASVADSLGQWMQTRRRQPALRTLAPYYDNPAYIAALASDISAQIGAMDFVPEALLLSFHGMPRRTLDLGDPYYCHCRKTARLLEEALRCDGQAEGGAESEPDVGLENEPDGGLESEPEPVPRSALAKHRSKNLPKNMSKNLRIEVSFQSRFGKAQWLEPATDTMLEALAGQGVKKLAVAAPGFAADCLETLEELGLEGRDQFLQGGGTHFHALRCLNDQAAGMEMLETLIGGELAGWLQ